MNLEVFSLCDAATIEGGKLNMLGAFDTIRVAKLPVVHPHCTIAMRLRFSAIEGENHRVSVKCIDADGKPIIPPMKGTIKLRYPDGQRSSSANLVLNVQGLKIENCGDYAIDLAVDGKNISSVPFYIRKKSAYVNE